MTGFIEIEVALNHKKLLPLGREKSGDELSLTFTTVEKYIVINQQLGRFSIFGRVSLTQGVLTTLGKAPKHHVFTNRRS